MFYPTILDTLLCRINLKRLDIHGINIAIKFSFSFCGASILYTLATIRFCQFFKVYLSLILPKKSYLIVFLESSRFPL